MKQVVVVFSCDRPGCEAETEVPRRDGHWDGQPAQEAMSDGWWITRDLTLCPAHEFWPDL